jgi:hypothetical protein
MSMIFALNVRLNQGDGVGSVFVGITARTRTAWRGLIGETARPAGIECDIHTRAASVLVGFAISMRRISEDPLVSSMTALFAAGCGSKAPCPLPKAAACERHNSVTELALSTRKSFTLPVAAQPNV